MMQISLPMYDLPCIKAATDEWGKGLTRALAREGFPDSSFQLTRGKTVEELWRSPGLLVSQTCGYPLLTEFADDLSLLMTPVYSAPGCEESGYRSLIIVREDSPAGSLEDMRGARCAINNWHSQSGMNVLRRKVAPFARQGKFFSEITVSGKHPDSIALIAVGEADVAAIDCVTYGLMARHDPTSVSAVRVLAETQIAPSLPYVTRYDASAETQRRITAALYAAMEDTDLKAAREDLMLDGFAALSLNDYAVMTEMASEAASLGYPILA